MSIPPAYTTISASPASIIAVGAVFPVLCTIAVGLRFYTRHVQKARLMADDWLTIPTLVNRPDTRIFEALMEERANDSEVTHDWNGTEHDYRYARDWKLQSFLRIGNERHLIHVRLSGAAKKGLGYPSGEPLDLTFEQELTYTDPQSTLIGIIEYEFQVIQILQLGLVKLSVLFFYRRIFCHNNSAKGFNRITWGVIAIIVLWTIAFFFAFLFDCGTHVDAQWTMLGNLIQYCDSLNSETAFAVSDMICDFIILVLPLPKIWSLQMPTSRRLAVTAVFLVGAVTLAASIVKMAIFIISVNEGLSADLNLVNTQVLYWSMIESGLALIAACLPSVHLLWSKLATTGLFATMISLISVGSRGSRGSRARAHGGNGSGSGTIGSNNKHGRLGRMGGWQNSGPDHESMYSNGAPSTGSQAQIVKGEEALGMGEEERIGLRDFIRGKRGGGRDGEKGMDLEMGERDIAVTRSFRVDDSPV
ncbi:hypothetical protein MMC25_006137 [Agyrium rufum]|nr:hypothetical protein [Agyrium rufum]